MAHFEEAPDVAWTLERWSIAAGQPNAREIVEIGQSIASPGFVREATNNWKKGTVQLWLNTHISDREDARAMIAVLRETARRNGLHLFDDVHLHEHAAIFMESRACRKGGFTPLKPEELAMIAGSPVPQTDPRYDDTSLLRKVYPPPPVTPFGRESDILHVLNVVRESPITVIVSDPGNGKTALAWHAARRAVRGGMVVGMDWNTDKRNMVTATGEERAITNDGSALRFETIITSAMRRFEWTEMYNAGDQKLPALATKRLADSRYLLVVDNLETVPQASQMVTALRGLVEPRGLFAPLSSRAIITSRVRVEDVPGVRHVYLDGLALEPSAELVRAIETDMGFETRCTDSQIERLWQLTKGNPLLLQIAITRCAQQNSQFDDILNDLDTGAGFMTVFDRVFGPLVDTMHQESAPAAFLAVYAAALSDLTLDRLRQVWDRDFGVDEPDFQSALSVLVRYGILRPVPSVPGEYAMHPMIRVYLRHLHSNE